LTTTIVITGATGFIGTWLCNKLDKIKEYSIIKVSRSQVDKTEFYRVNTYKQVPSGDILIHLGENPDRVRVNQIGEPYRQETRGVIESIIKKGYKKIVYCSSSVVYGNEATEPYSENMQTCADDVYAISKLENEARVLESGGVIVRLSNVIGVGMSKRNVLSDILKQLSGKGVLTIHNVKPIQDFIYIDDAVDAVVSLLQTETSGIFNVGSGVATSINQLTETVLDIAGQKDRTINSTIISSEHSYNVLNIEKIEKITGWKPKYTQSQLVETIVNSL